MKCNRGPGFRISDFESNRIIGDAQFRGAQSIMNGPLSAVSGAVRSVHVYVEM
jgi:neutral ceramidase